MPADKYVPQNWLDDTAKATRVTMVASDGSSSSTPGTQRAVTTQRILGAATTNVTAGKKSVTFLVNAASASSTTINGAATAMGSKTFSVISNNDTLPAFTLVTVAGDDVEILTLA